MTSRGNLLRAGAAQVDITPRSLMQMAGEVGWFRPGQYVYDPLYAKALVVDNNGKKACIVTLDLTIVTREWASRIREEAARRLGTDPRAVMVHATQTHTAPALGHFMFDKEFKNIPPEMEWLGGGDSRYFPFAYERILQAVEEAHETMQPAWIRTGSGIEGRVQFNRRAVNHAGMVQMPGPRWQPPLGPTYIHYLEGPIDPEVGVIVIQNEALQVLALVLHHTGHPVNVFPKEVISADWCGAWAARMQKRFGPRCVGLVVNGCCGNINPWNCYDPDYVPDHQRMGRLLAETTANVVDGLTIEDDVTVDFASDIVWIPMRDVSPEDLKEARDILTKHPEPLWCDTAGYAAYENNQRASRPPHRTVDAAWMRAAGIMSNYLQKQREPRMDYEIQALRIGRTAVVGLPGEPFVEGQLRIKLESPTYPTYVAHCCNMYVGYIPTEEAFARGGHEVFYSKLVPEALATIVKHTRELIGTIFKE